MTDQPYKHIIPVFGATIQNAKAADTFNKLDYDGKQNLQQVTGNFLYYAQVVYPIMPVSLSAIASSQAAPAEETMNRAKYFLY